MAKPIFIISMPFESMEKLTRAEKIKINEQFSDYHVLYIAEKSLTRSMFQCFNPDVSSYIDIHNPSADVIQSGTIDYKINVDDKDVRDVLSEYENVMHGYYAGLIRIFKLIPWLFGSAFVVLCLMLTYYIFK